jgi:hypothetical protein
MMARVNGEMALWLEELAKAAGRAFDACEWSHSTTFDDATGEETIILKATYPSLRRAQSHIAPPDPIQHPGPVYREPREWCRFLGSARSGS